MSARIRPVTEADYAAVTPLAGELGYPTPAEEIRARLRRLAAREDHLVLVAEERGSVVGWLHAARRLSLEAGEYAEIGGMVVDGAHRSRGIGEALVRAAEAWAGGQGLLVLRVKSNVVRQRAHAFYERLGFAATKSQMVFQKALPRGALEVPPGRPHSARNASPTDVLPPVISAPATKGDRGTANLP